MGYNQDLKSEWRLKDRDGLEDMLEYRRKGFTYRDIADLMNCSAMTIQRRIERYIRETNAVNAPAFRDMENARLEVLWERAMEAVEDIIIATDSRGNPIKVPVLTADGQLVLDEAGQPVTKYQIDRAPMLAGIAAAIRISERRANLLGLNMPQKLAVTNNTPQAGPAEITFRIIEAQSGRHLTDEERQEVLERTAIKPASLFDEDE